MKRLTDWGFFFFFFFLKNIFLFISLFIWWRKLEQVWRRRGRGGMIHRGDGDMRLLRSFKLMMDVWDWVSRSDWSVKSLYCWGEGKKKKPTSARLLQERCSVKRRRQIRGVMVNRFIDPFQIYFVLLLILLDWIIFDINEFLFIARHNGTFFDSRPRSKYIYLFITRI